MIGESAVIDRDAYLSVAGEVCDGIAAVLNTLDDETVNWSPLPGLVNPVHALVVHAHGMACYWGGSVIAGEGGTRDRDAEFRARGTVEESRALLTDLRSRLPDWVDAAAHGVRDPHAPGTSRTDAGEASAGWILQHVLHELAQHLGHMQICRDLALARRTS